MYYLNNYTYNTEWSLVSVVRGPYFQYKKSFNKLAGIKSGQRVSDDLNGILLNHNSRISWALSELDYINPNKIFMPRIWGSSFLGNPGHTKKILTVNLLFLVNYLGIAFLFLAVDLIIPCLPSLLPDCLNVCISQVYRFSSLMLAASWKPLRST